MELDSVKISFGLPAFKIEFLKEAIESILNQSYSNFELIIVDDCSPNDVKGVVNQFSDSRIKYYRNSENLGGKNLVAVWNKCLDLADGEYFVMAGDDDLYDKDFLYHNVRKIREYPECHLLCCRYKIINSKDGVIGLSEAHADYMSNLDYLWHLYNSSTWQCIGNYVFNTSALKKNGGFIEFPKAWHSDYATCIMTSAKGGVVNISEVLFSWRMSGLNISSNGKHFKEKLEANVLYEKWVLKFIESIHPANQIEGYQVKVLSSVVKKSLYRKKVGEISNYPFGDLFKALIGGNKKYIAIGVSKNVFYGIMINRISKRLFNCSISFKK